MAQFVTTPTNVDLFALVKRKANLPSLMLGAGSVLAGTGAAALRGNMEILAASICLIFACFAQLAANLTHYYMMLNRRYENMPRPKMHNPKLLGNNIAVRVLREAGFACSLIAVMVGLCLMTMAEQPFWTLILGLIILISNLMLTRGKHPMFGSPWALVFTWIIFGPVAVWGTSYLQVQHEAVKLWSMFDNSPSLLLGFCMGFLACNVQILYVYSMDVVDPGCNPNSLCTRVGRRFVQWLAFFNGLIPLCSMIWGVMYLNIQSPEIAIVPIFLGFALNTYITLRMDRAPIGELVHLSMLAKINYLLTGLTTFLFWWYIGAPDSSMSVFF